MSFRPILVSTLTLLIALTNDSFAFAADVAPECRNYKGQLEQLTGKISRFQKSCTNYEAKVEKSESQIDKIEQALEADNLTKREISRFNNKIKSLTRTLQNQRKYATRYCDTVNNLQEKYAKLEETCKTDDSGENPAVVTKVIKPLECFSNGYRKICYKIVLENDKCLQQYDNTYYFRDYFEDDFQEYSKLKMNIIFPTSFEGGQVGLTWKIVANRSLEASECIVNTSR